MIPFKDRIASAPISWGICEVPGWGAMLPTDRVLSEMTGLGIRATELGAPGFLPDAATGINDTMEKHGMQLLGGFTPLVLHRPEFRDAAIAEARRVAALFAATGAKNFVTSTIVDPDWSNPTPMTAGELSHLVEMLKVVDGICDEHGLQQVLHPHVQTVVETRDDINRVLDSSDCRWCFDTGHVAISGFDPMEFAKSAASRIGHVHLKDVNMSKVEQVLSREVTLMNAVQDGLFTSLGAGDVPIADIVLMLEASGYQGWYVIEQDTAITGAIPAEGAGPMDDVRSSLDYLATEVTAKLA
jgi:inosose dehydratase